LRASASIGLDAPHGASSDRIAGGGAPGPLSIALPGAADRAWTGIDTGPAT